MTIRFFAASADVVGSSLLEGADVKTVGDVRRWLADMYPQASALWAKCLIAVDQAYAEDDVELDDGCEVAVIPPVSGG
jgi:molybdopterin converting factor subunit 1